MRRARLAESARADYAALNAESPSRPGRLQRPASTPSSRPPRPPDRAPPARRGPRALGPWDACAVFKVRHALMGSFGNKLWRLRILKTLGPEWINRLLPGSATTPPLVVPPGATYEDPCRTASTSSIGLAQLILGLGDVDGGSNNWVVHGSRTASGKPLWPAIPTAPSTSRTSTTRTTWPAPSSTPSATRSSAAPHHPLRPQRPRRLGRHHRPERLQRLLRREVRTRRPVPLRVQGRVASLPRRQPRRSPCAEAAPSRSRSPSPATARSSSATRSRGTPWPWLRLDHRAEHLVRRAAADAPREVRRRARRGEAALGRPRQQLRHGRHRQGISATSRAARSRPARPPTPGSPSPAGPGEYEWTGLVPFEEMPRASNRSRVHRHRQPADRRAGLPAPRLARLRAPRTGPPGSTPGSALTRPPPPTWRPSTPTRSRSRAGRSSTWPVRSSPSTPPPPRPATACSPGTATCSRPASRPPSTPSGARRSPRRSSPTPLRAAGGDRRQVGPVAEQRPAAGPAAPQRLLQPARPARHLDAAARARAGSRSGRGRSPPPSPGSQSCSARTRPNGAGSGSTAPGRATRSRTPSRSTPSCWTRPRSALAATATPPRTAPSPARTPATTRSRPAR